MYFWTILTHESTCTRAGLPSHPGKSSWNTDCQMIPKDGGTALSSAYCMCIGHEADDDVGQEDIKNGRTKKDGEIARQTDRHRNRTPSQARVTFRRTKVLDPSQHGRGSSPHPIGHQQAGSYSTSLRLWPMRWRKSAAGPCISLSQALVSAQQEAQPGQNFTPPARRVWNGSTTS